MNIEQTLKERAKEAETTVVSYLPEVTGYPKTVLEAMEYSVEAGGKRIRPVLMREVYHMCGGIEDSLIAASSLSQYSRTILSSSIWNFPLSSIITPFCRKSYTFQKKFRFKKGRDQSHALPFFYFLYARIGFKASASFSFSASASARSLPSVV